MTKPVVNVVRLQRCQLVWKVLPHCALGPRTCCTGWCPEGRSGGHNNKIMLIDWRRHWTLARLFFDQARRGWSNPSCLRTHIPTWGGAPWPQRWSACAARRCCRQFPPATECCNHPCLHCRWLWFASSVMILGTPTISTPAAQDTLAQHPWGTVCTATGRRYHGTEDGAAHSWGNISIQRAFLCPWHSGRRGDCGVAYYNRPQWPMRPNRDEHNRRLFCEIEVKSTA